MIVQRNKLNQRRILSEKSDKIIRKYAFSSGIFGYVPIPLLDALGIMAVQRKMLFDLAKVYNVPFSQSLAKDLLKTFSRGLVSRAAFPMAIKLIPGVNILLGNAGMAAVGSASTYAVGKVIQKHFEEGGTFKNFSAVAKNSIFEAELKTGLKLSKK